MRTVIYFFYGLDVEIRPKMDPPELFIHLGGAIGICKSRPFDGVRVKPERESAGCCKIG